MKRTSAAWPRLTVRVVKSSDARAVKELLAADRVHDRATERRAARIIESVRTDGDRALRRYAHELDGLVGPLEIPRSDWELRAREVQADVRWALERAAAHIHKVASAQRPRGGRVLVARGITVEQRVVALDRVGCYVPGGLYPLPSSLLMTAIPARVAGVAEVIAVSPRPHPAVVAAALVAGVDRLFQAGGAHAVAALAYGTQTIPRVDKIVGPGNRWVAAAKALVAADCGIDFHAGPTEILIVSESGRADWIAADLIAQAEHDPDARAVLLTSNRQLAREVADVVRRLLPDDGPARLSLTRHGAIVLTRDTDEAMALANAAAPEHLVVDNERMARQVRAAGAVFVGPWTAQAAGDYAIGSNHVLPTAGAARTRGGLNTADFVRIISIQRMTRDGFAAIAPTAVALAGTEGLVNHAQSIDIRRSSRPARREAR